MDTTERTVKNNNLIKILIGARSQRHFKETSMFRMREKVQETRAKVIEPNFTIFMFFPLLLRGLSPLVFNWIWFPNFYCFFLYLWVFPAYNLEVRIFVLSLFFSLLKTVIFKIICFYFSVHIADISTVLQSVSHSRYYRAGYCSGHVPDLCSAGTRF